MNPDYVEDDLDPGYVPSSDDPFLNDNDGWDDLDADPAALAHATGQADEAAPRKSIATQLVELAESRYVFAISDDGDPVALAQDGPNVAHPLRGGRLGLRAALADAYFNSTGKAAPSGALADALAVIEGKCQRAESIDVHHRVGPHDGGVVVDLGTPDGRAVVINGDGWRIVDRSPVTFARSDLTVALPDPVRAGRDIMAAPIGNVSIEDWPLVVGWLAAAFLPGIGHPIAFLRGEQGVGKTTMARRIIGIVDPSAAPVRSTPKDLEQWVVAASGSWAIALDNLTTIPGWFSDALCRAVTGEGMVRRRLYTDSGLAVTRFRRVVLLTAIDGGSLRGDLADRVLPIELDRIDPGDRRTDAELADAWDRELPEVLAAVFDLLVEVLTVLPGIELDTMPRMADFARILAAIDRVRPCGRSGRSTSLGRYLNTTRSLQADVLDDDPLATAIVDLIDRTGTWEGTATALLERLDPPEPSPRTWPKSARGIAGRLRTITPALRTVAINVDYSVGTDRKRSRLIHLARNRENGNQPSAPSAPSAQAADLGFLADGRGRDPEPQPSAPSAHRPHKSPGQTPSDGADGWNRHKSAPVDPFAPIARPDPFAPLEPDPL